MHVFLLLLLLLRAKKKKWEGAHFQKCSWGGNLWSNSTGRPSSSTPLPSFVGQSALALPSKPNETTLTRKKKKDFFQGNGNCFGPRRKKLKQAQECLFKRSHDTQFSMICAPFDVEWDAQYPADSIQLSCDSHKKITVPSLSISHSWHSIDQNLFRNIQSLFVQPLFDLFSIVFNCLFEMITSQEFTTYLFSIDLYCVSFRTSKRKIVNRCVMASWIDNFKM